MSINHYQEALDHEFFEMKMMELKKTCQEKLLSLLIPRFESISDQSPYQNIREEAYDFIEHKVSSVSSMRHPFQRNIMEGSLNQFLVDIEQNGTRSSIYREFNYLTRNSVG